MDLSAFRPGRFITSLGVGGVATLVDLLALALLVEAFGLSANQANVPALLAGAAVQFIGCRHLVFRAGEGQLSKQVLGFVGVEIATLALNGLLFHALLVLTPLPYVLVRVIGTFLVYVSFSYPMWHLVFAERPRTSRGASRLAVDAE